MSVGERRRGQTALEFIMITGAVILFAVLVVTFLRTGVISRSGQQINQSSADFFQTLEDIVAGVQPQSTSAGVQCSLDSDCAATTGYCSNSVCSNKPCNSDSQCTPGSGFCSSNSCVPLGSPTPSATPISPPGVTGSDCNFDSDCTSPLECQESTPGQFGGTCQTPAVILPVPSPPATACIADSDCTATQFCFDLPTPQTGGYCEEQLVFTSTGFNGQTFGSSSPTLVFSLSQPSVIDSALLFSTPINVVNFVQTSNNLDFSINLLQAGVLLDNGVHSLTISAHSIATDFVASQEFSFTVAASNPNAVCALDSQCSTGEICSYGVCEATSAVQIIPPNPNGGSCVYDVDCESGLICSQATSGSQTGVCAIPPSVTPTPPPVTCVVDSQCSASTYCSPLNLCAAKPCALDFECGAGSYCSGSFCSQTGVPPAIDGDQCILDSECLPDAYCPATVSSPGSCASPIPTPTAVPCTIDSECQSGYCSGSTCFVGTPTPTPSGDSQDCALDADCSIGQYCPDAPTPAACTATPAPTVTVIPCQTDDNCPLPQVCGQVGQASACVAPPTDLTPPLVSVAKTSPAGSVLTGQEVTVEATASDAQTGISSIALSYSIGGGPSTSLGSCSSSPCAKTFTPSLAGQYSVSAVATNGQGLSSTADPISFSASNPDSNPPSVSSFSVTPAGTIYSSTTGVQLSATATDAENTISYVKIYYKKQGDSTYSLLKTCTSPVGGACQTDSSGVNSLDGKLIGGTSYWYAEAKDSANNIANPTAPTSSPQLQSFSVTAADVLDPIISFSSTSGILSGQPFDVTITADDDKAVFGDEAGKINSLVVSYSIPGGSSTPATCVDSNPADFEFVCTVHFDSAVQGTYSFSATAIDNALPTLHSVTRTHQESIAASGFPNIISFSRTPNDDPFGPDNAVVTLNAVVCDDVALSSLSFSYTPFGGSATSLACTPLTAGASVPCTVTSGPSYSCTAQFSVETDGQYLYSLSATDNAGQTTTTSPSSFTADVTAPDITSLAYSPGGTIYPTTSNVVLSA
ncbi:hypothetical protein HY993_03175, partial [Candidatus Micrarchaeota archaeon]|nr:hypothetical protein [Candidatus Micrarchaeota archaeon]